ncbi:MAG TPA: glycosyltransferase family 1 protein [Candidatus Omnitrophota bacterium]|nr:glycosyltransferase family 1 protein [Candidatus Omnitrophota bacterium]
MRIAIHCRSFMNKQFTGIGRYASSLARALEEIDQHNEYLLYAPKGLFHTKRSVPSAKARNFTVKVDWLGRGLSKMMGATDIVHLPSPDICDVKDVKLVVTIHDLVYKAFPQGHTEETLKLTDEQMRFLLPRASKFICCSQNTAKDLMRFFQVESARISVVYPGINKDIFYQMGEEEKPQARHALKALGVEGPFILFVGTIEGRKNLKNLLKGFALLKQRGNYSGKLVVCGMAGWKNEDLSRTIDELNLRNELLLPGFLKDEELRYLYNSADCFVFPSFYEGFGYPIVEAFSCGCPVVTSNAASCPEVGGDAAVTVDPQNPEEIATAIRPLLEDSALRMKLIERGLQRAEGFDYLKTARNTLKVYEEVYES